jgi:hypothetical protein
MERCVTAPPCLHSHCLRLSTWYILSGLLPRVRNLMLTLCVAAAAAACQALHTRLQGPRRSCNATCRSTCDSSSKGRGTSAADAASCKHQEVDKHQKSAAAGEHVMLTSACRRSL